MGMLSDYSRIPSKRGGGARGHSPYVYFKEKEGGGCLKRLYLGRSRAGERIDIEGGEIIPVNAGGLKVNNQGFVELGKMERGMVEKIASDCGLEVREY